MPSSPLFSILTHGKCLPLPVRLKIMRPSNVKNFVRTLFLLLLILSTPFSVSLLKNSRDSRSKASTSEVTLATEKHNSSSKPCANVDNLFPSLNISDNLTSSPTTRPKSSNYFHISMPVPDNCLVTHQVCPNYNCTNQSIIQGNVANFIPTADAYSIKWFFSKIDSPLATLSNKSLLIPQVGQYASQYSPYALSFPGWEGSLTYYCKLTNINGVSRDRVWRAEERNGVLVDNRVVIDGVLNQIDDMSCSPGVVIDNNNLWHMYYVAAKRDASVNNGLYLLHATAPPPGTVWSKKGPLVIEGLPQPFPYYIETPSLILDGNSIILYLIADNGRLMRATSTDGFNFSRLTQVYQVPSTSAQSGRVSKINGIYYLTWATNRSGKYDPPTEVWIASSENGLTFTNPQPLFGTSQSDWDSTYTMTPHLFKDYASNQIRLVYAANKGKYDWFGSNTAIGTKIVNNLNHSVLPSATPTPTLRPPTLTPTRTPTRVPTLTPTSRPILPTSTPTLRPTRIPSPTPTLLPTNLPTLTPSTRPSSTSTPVPTQVIGDTCTTCSNSNLKSKGDANCDGRIDILDRSIWSSEFLVSGVSQIKKSTWLSDFNCDGYVDIVDRSIWSSNFSL